MLEPAPELRKGGPREGRLPWAAAPWWSQSLRGRRSCGGLPKGHVAALFQGFSVPGWGVLVGFGFARFRLMFRNGETGIELQGFRPTMQGPGC